MDDPMSKEDLLFTQIEEENIIGIKALMLDGVSITTPRIRYKKRTYSPLEYACIVNSPSVLKFLHEHGATTDEDLVNISSLHSGIRMIETCLAIPEFRKNIEFCCWIADLLRMSTDENSLLYLNTCFEERIVELPISMVYVDNTVRYAKPNTLAMLLEKNNVDVCSYQSRPHQKDLMGILFESIIDLELYEDKPKETRTWIA